MELDHLYGCLCIHQQTCASMKALLVADTLMSYPDRNFLSIFFTNVSDYQLRTIKEFRSMSLNAVLHVHTEHHIFFFITLHRNSACSPVEDLY